MNKFYGNVGYVETVETTPGIYEPQATEKKYYGDVLKESRYLTPGEKVNDDFTVRNRISIVADPYANQHFHNIRYAEWMGTKWIVKGVEVAMPRLILTLGGVYNE